MAVYVRLAEGAGATAVMEFAQPVVGVEVGEAEPREEVKEVFRLVSEELELMLTWEAETSSRVECTFVSQEQKEELVSSEAVE